MTMKENKQVTRKDFLKGMGMSLAGVAVVGSVGGLLTACTGTGTASATVETTGSTDKPQWPFKYTKLDPDKVTERAFKGYKEKGG